MDTRLIDPQWTMTAAMFVSLFSGKALVFIPKMSQRSIGVYSIRLLHALQVPKRDLLLDQVEAHREPMYILVIDWDVDLVGVEETTFYSVGPCLYV